MTIYTVFLSLFFVMNPFGDMATFVSVLAPFSHKRQRMIILREMIIAFFVLITFVFFGENVLNYMGITQTTLQLAGGVILFLMAIKMIFPSHNNEIEQSKKEPFIVPLALPVAADPGLIATLIIYSHQMPSNFHLFIAFTCAWAVSLAIYLSSSFIKKFIGDFGTEALTKLGGIILSMVAVQMMTRGVIHILKEAA
mgnify:CR=1 FL=1